MAAASTRVDKRYKYLRAIWPKVASGQIANHCEKEWIHLCRVLARISLASEPLTSRFAVRDTVRGCGQQVDVVLKGVDESAASSTSPPRHGMYCGAAAALLVALLDHTELAESRTPAPKEAGVVAKETLLDAAATMCEQPFIASAAHAAAAADATPAPRCAAHQQLNSMGTTGLGLVKEVQRKKLCATGVAYMLTDAGRAKAIQLRASGEAADAAPLFHHQRVRPGERGVVVLLVDEREGGGAQHHLRELGAALTREGCRFETRVLPRGLGDCAHMTLECLPGVLPWIPSRDCDESDCVLVLPSPLASAPQTPSSGATGRRMQRRPSSRVSSSASPPLTWRSRSRTADGRHSRYAHNS